MKAVKGGSTHYFPPFFVPSGPMKTAFFCSNEHTKNQPANKQDILKLQLTIALIN